MLLSMSASGGKPDVSQWRPLELWFEAKDGTAQVEDASSFFKLRPCSA